MQEAEKVDGIVSSDAGTEAEKKRTSYSRRIAVTIALLIFAFLLGSVPARLSEREAARQRDAAQLNLRISRLQNRLATAAINARRGEYEPARIAASDFFTDLRAEIARRESAFSIAQREAVKPILDERDELLNLLARADGAAVERFMDLYLKYTRAIGSPPQ